MSESVEPGDPRSVISIRGLAHRFGPRTLFEGLDLEVPGGAVFGLLGRNGSGKTTTLQMLMGLLRRQEGEIEVLGHDPAREPLEVRAKVGYVPERPKFYPWMRVGELIGFVARHRPTWDDAWATELVRRFGLDAGRRIGGLSKGENAMLALLIAVAFRPPLLVLDEPAQGLDPVARRRFFEGVLAGYGEEGGTVVISSHLIRDISTLVDHVAILGRGGLLCSASVESLRRRIRAFRVAPAGDSVEDSIRDIEGLRLLGCEQFGRQRRVVIELARPVAEGVEPGELLTRRLGGSAAVQVEAVQVEEESLDLEEIFLAFGGGDD